MDVVEPFYCADKNKAVTLNMQYSNHAPLTANISAMFSHIKARENE